MRNPNSIPVLIGAALILVLFVYAFFAFTLLDLNPLTWPPLLRGLATLITLVVVSRAYTKWSKQ